VTEGGVIVGQRLCGEWKSTQPRPKGWRIIFLITFWRPIQATPASAEEHPPSGEHRQGTFLPQISGYTRRRDAAGQARLRLCLHSFIEVFAELLLPSTAHVTSAGVVHGKSWGCQCAHTLSSCFQGRIIIRLLSPPRLPKMSKDQPLHTITSAKHQPNTIWQNHLRLSSFRQSVVLACFPANTFFLSSFFHPHVPFPNTCRSDDTNIQSISCNRLHMFLHYFCMDVVEIKWGHQGCGGVTNLIRSSEEFGSGAYGL
jgi:hypothetical protein